MALTKINASVIANNTIAVGNIADNSVDATKIASNSILTRHIDDDQITGDQLADNVTIAGVLTATSISVGDSHTIGNDGFDNLELTSSTSENIVLKPAGSVYLYNAGAAKLVTTSTGIDVTGTVLAENLTLNAGTPGPHLSFENVGGSTRIKETNSASFYYQAYNHTFEGHTGIDRLHISQIGDISFYEDTGSTAKLFWDASAESLLIGTATDIMHANMDDLQVGTTSGSRGITIASGSDSYGTLAFGDGATGNEAYRGFVEYYHNDDSMRLGSGGAERVRIDSSGSLGVGTNNPGSLLHVAHSNGGVNPTARIENTTGTVATNSVLLDLKFSGDDSFSNCDYVKFQDSSGEEGVITGDGGGRVYYEINSDYRLKENILNYSGGLDKIKALSVKTYNYKTRPGTTYTGFLAHEVAEVVDGVARGTKDAVNPDGTPDYQGMDLSKLVPDLVSAIQELEARITTLEG